MQRPTHDPAMISLMIGERHAHADADRLAALARGRKTSRPSRLAQVSGRLATLIASSVRHQPMTHTTPRTIRP